MRRVDTRLAYDTYRRLIFRDADRRAALACPITALPAIGHVDAAGPIEHHLDRWASTALDRMVDDRIIDDVTDNRASEGLAAAVELGRERRAVREPVDDHASTSARSDVVGHDVAR